MMPIMDTATPVDAVSGAPETGYLSSKYADAFGDFGRPRKLDRSGGWILERPIPDTDLVDAMGLYPLFCCKDWSRLPDDLAELGDNLISLALVTDPLGAYDEDILKRSFDRVQPYKEHFIAEVSEPLESFVSKSHRQNARRALRKLTVEICEEPQRYIDDWVDLYAVLTRKHDVSGLRAFSRTSFEHQFATPGMVLFRAVLDGETVGMDLWYVDGDVAQGHLAAFSETGYAASASYATKWTLLQYFADKVRWVNLGGHAGTPGTSSGGLTHFKKGWSSTTRRTYFCGRVFDDPAYQRLSQAMPNTAYFPAYREGEL